MKNIVVIGAGHGGTQLVASLREAGHEGPITLVSNEIDWPYHKPPLSKTFVRATDTSLEPLRAEVFFKNENVTLLRGRVAQSLNREAQTVCLDDATELPYDHLVLATGASPNYLALPGANAPNVNYLRSATDARELRGQLFKVRRAVIVGGGFIGLELAATLRCRGVEVVVVEMAVGLLGRVLSKDMAVTIAEYLNSLGVQVRCDAAIDTLIREDGRVVKVRLRGGEVIEADLLAVGIGVQPNDRLAREAGLVVDNGIVVDTLLSTSDPAVHAIGDCARFPQAQLDDLCRLESVQNATDQARALAATLTGEATPYTALPWFWSDIGEKTLQIVGLSRDADEHIVSRNADGTVKSVYWLRSGVLVAVETIDSSAEHVLARRLISEGLTPPVEVMGAGDAGALKRYYKSARANRR